MRYASDPCDITHEPRARSIRRCAIPPVAPSHHSLTTPTPPPNTRAGVEVQPQVQDAHDDDEVDEQARTLRAPRDEKSQGYRDERPSKRPKEGRLDSPSLRRTELSVGCTSRATARTIRRASALRRRPSPVGEGALTPKPACPSRRYAGTRRSPAGSDHRRPTSAVSPRTHPRAAQRRRRQARFPLARRAGQAGVVDEDRHRRHPQGQRGAQVKRAAPVYE